MQDVQARETNPWVSDVAAFQEKFEKKFDTSTGPDYTPPNLWPYIKR